MIHWPSGVNDGSVNTLWMLLANGLLGACSDRTAEGSEFQMAHALQVAPFPAAQLGRALIQQLLGATDVVGRPFALGDHKATEVEMRLRPPPLLLCLCLRCR